jgi:hypothetical protein
MADDKEEARLRAEARFKKKQHADEEAAKVWAERTVAEKAGDQNRARLKSLRLTRDAAEKPTEGTPKRKLKRSAGQSSNAPAMDDLVQETKKREVLPTHRQVPVEKPGSGKSKRK